MISIIKAIVQDAIIIKQLAEDTWWETYSDYISKEQLRYMLDTIYSLDTIQKQITTGEQDYIILYENNPRFKPWAAVGFASFAARIENKTVYKLHKLYCLQHTKGKGYGKMLLQEVENNIISSGKNILELNVNRNNPAKIFYEKMGFKVVYEEDIPVGDFWMNDYVMRKILK